MIGNFDRGPRPMTDADAIILRRHLERNHGFEPISRELMRDALTAHCAVHRIDSAQEWLNRQVWDGVGRVEQFCEVYLGASDTPYVRAVSRYIWTALAGRVLEPGCQCDMVPVLVGAQGSGKTSAIKALAPIPDTYVEINLDVHDDNLSRLVRGKLVGEIAELRGLGSRDAEAIKAWLSRTHEEWIPKYQEYATKYPRRIVFFGTTNIDRFLADETGERRWLPTVTGKIDVGAILRDRDQLWAEGAALWAAGGVQFADAEQLAPEIHAEHKEVDVWETDVKKWLDGVDFGDGMDGGGPQRWSLSLTSSQVLAGALCLKAGAMTKREERRVGACLRRLGFVSKPLRVDGEVVRRWVNETRSVTDLV